MERFYERERERERERGERESKIERYMERYLLKKRSLSLKSVTPLLMGGATASMGVY